MNKNIAYVALAAFAGLLIGYLLFGSSPGVGDIHEGHEHASAQELWTCSMHPQISQPEPGDCPICGMDLIPAEAGFDGLSPDQFRLTENAQALANVRTTTVGSLDSKAGGTLSLSGKITINEEAVSVQASYFEGRVEQLYVNFEGQKIRKGQKLATLYSPELVAAQQELLTAASIRETDPRLYQAVRNKLKLWKLSEAQIDRIESSGTVEEFTPVYATVSGTVTEIMSAEGDYLKTGQPIARLSDLSTVWAELDAYEDQLARLREGQVLELTSRAYPNRSVKGRIAFIDPQLNSRTRTAKVRVTLDNSEGLFKPGMFVAGQIEAAGEASQDDRLFVPASAVMWTGERSLVYLRARPGEPVFEMREVQIGEREGDRIEVVSGLKSGEEIVTHGTFTIDAAAQLKGKRSMMNRPSARAEAGGEVRSILKAAMPGYLRLKDALVASDPRQTAAEARTVLERIGTADLSALNPDERELLTRVQQALRAVSQSRELEKQRELFVGLNEALLGLARGSGSLGDTLYVQQCPMANNSKGAVWISSEQEIRNPYYGDAMLSCGSVIQVLE